VFIPDSLWKVLGQNSQAYCDKHGWQDVKRTATQRDINVHALGHDYPGIPSEPLF